MLKGVKSAFKAEGGLNLVEKSENFVRYIVFLTSGKRYSFVSG
jgi:hypothetical protein